MTLKETDLYYDYRFKNEILYRNYSMKMKITVDKIKHNITYNYSQCFILNSIKAV